MSTFYETDSAVEQYLLFHYGTPEQICPILPEAQSACGFPARCAQEFMPDLAEYRRKRALDLGCAVGRSSLELGLFFDQVLGIDYSHRFIAAAQMMQNQREVTIQAQVEGELYETLCLQLPSHLTSKNPVCFQQGDACALDPEIGRFDFVLMANLIDRLPNPRGCLNQIPSFIHQGGLLLITSPYTWLEDYTPKTAWMGSDQGTFGTLSEILTPCFELEKKQDLPFLIREHRRKYQWSIAEATLWRRL